MKYLLLFWAVVSAIVGLFGWSKFSDLDVLVQNQVRLQLPKEKQAFADYQAQVEKAAELSARYSALAERFEQSDAALRRAEQVGKAFDIEGDLQRLLVESTARERNTDLESFSEQKEVDYTGTLLEPKWRKEVIATLRLFKDSLQERSYPADLIFNATQVCRRLDQSSLAEQLTEEAFKKDPSPPILALYYSSRVSALTGSERDEAFAKLMSLVATLPDNSPQIVLAEGVERGRDWATLRGVHLGARCSTRARRRGPLLSLRPEGPGPHAVLEARRHRRRPGGARTRGHRAHARDDQVAVVQRLPTRARRDVRRPPVVSRPGRDQPGPGALRPPSITFVPTGPRSCWSGSDAYRR